MPAMNGPDFYLEAVKEDAGIGVRFLFCSAEITADHERFFGRKRLALSEETFFSK